MDKNCSKCKLAKPVSEFYKNKSKPDGYGNMCKDCMRDYGNTYSKTDKGREIQKEMKRRKRERALNLIKEAKNKPCADCGNEYPHYVMDFDHLGNEEKLFNIGNTSERPLSLTRLQTEIDKCDVVCSNCHRIRTHNRRGAHGPKAVY